MVTLDAKIPRHLITTDDERTWKFDRPVIFLGEWCCLYDRKHIWQNMDAIIAAPYGLGQSRKDADHAEARALEEAFFPVLCETLNKFHGTKHGTRFWKIVLGHWFHRYVDVILNRVRTLELCSRHHQLSGTTAFSDECYALAPQDSYEAIWAFNDSRWNSVLYGRILNLLGATDCPVEIISGDASAGFRWPAAGPERNPGRRILKWGYRHARKLAGLLARENDAFIINSFLPRKEEIKLQLILGQVPQLWASPKFALTENPDRALRQSLSAKIAGAADDSLADILHTMVFELLPVCYLEGFAELTEGIKQLPWPKEPKFIFTSNNFDMDEVFKLWAATKVESGFKYVTGQHGSNYGTSRYMYPAVEEATADRFLTWGWADGLPQHSPAFIFKTAGRKAGGCNPSGGLVLIELHAGLMLSTWDVTAEFKAYFEDQQRFIEMLQNSPREQLTVRLHHGHINLKWCEEGRWKEFDPTVKLDTGSSDISKLIAQSRLVIHSYDSAGILETLSQNIQTIAFWRNDLEHLRDSAKPYYQLLVDAGIVHFTPESAAAKVNEVWDDVAGWWRQTSVQEARKQFCDRYARVSRQPVSELKIILSGDIS
jgi:putative transferase (TIGR04331 family)